MPRRPQRGSEAEQVKLPKFSTQFFAELLEGYPHPGGIWDVEEFTKAQRAWDRLEPSAQTAYGIALRALEPGATLDGDRLMPMTEYLRRLMPTKSAPVSRKASMRTASELHFIRTSLTIPEPIDASKCTPSPHSEAPAAPQRTHPEDCAAPPEYESAPRRPDSPRAALKLALLGPNDERSAYEFRNGRGRKRQSSKRRRSKRGYYARNAARERKKARQRSKKNRARVLEQQRQRRQADRNRPHPPRRRLTAEEWRQLEYEYRVSHAQGQEPVTFKELALRYRVSVAAIKRRSSLGGGWGLRTTYDT